MKTSPVYFHAQRTSIYSTANTILPFEILRLNLGGGINTSGLFVAPKTGKYFFILSGMSDVNVAVRVEMQIKTDTGDLDENHTRQRSWYRWLSRLFDTSQSGTGKRQLSSENNFDIRKNSLSSRTKIVFPRLQNGPDTFDDVKSSFQLARGIKISLNVVRSPADIGPNYVITN